MSWRTHALPRAQMNEQGKKEYIDLIRDARSLLQSRNIVLPYRAVVIDEAQDMSAEAFRLLRAVVPTGENDIFLVGDAHQRIYRHRVTLGQCGINIKGLRSLSRSDTTRPGRKQLVGLMTEDPKRVLTEGGQIVAASSYDIPVPMLGHVTSSYMSARVGRSVALGVVKGGLTKFGESVYVVSTDTDVVRATIVKPVFYDPEGKLQVS